MSNSIGAYDLAQKATSMTNNIGYFFIALLVVGVAIGVGVLFWQRGHTMPVIQGFENKEEEEEEVMSEGFAGVAVGAGMPECLRSSSDAARLYSMVSDPKLEEGTADFKEFALLLSQLCCFKKDLLGVAGVVEATRYQEFNTQLNLEPIAETTARCFAKTIPSRDLELAFDKWQKRGHFLLTRLCTAAGLSEAQFISAEGLFKNLLTDVKTVATSKCLSGEPTINAEPAPREVKNYQPPTLNNLGPYMGYY
jgi:hypothetical protein